MNGERQCKAQVDLQRCNETQKGGAQMDWTQLEAARSCPKASKSWATGRMKISIVQELRVLHKGWPFHLYPVLLSF